MIYTCNHCRFTFSRVGKVDDCPDCGKSAIREATEKEKQEHKENRSIWEKEEDKGNGE